MRTLSHATSTCTQTRLYLTVKVGGLIAGYIATISCNSAAIVPVIHVKHDTVVKYMYTCTYTNHHVIWKFSMSYVMTRYDMSSHNH